MSTYRTHIDSGPTVRAVRSGRATDLGQLRSARLDHLDRFIQHVPAPAQAPSDPSTNGPKTAQSTAEVVGIRLLAVLTVAMFVTSIIGLTISVRAGTPPRQSSAA